MIKLLYTWRDDPGRSRAECDEHYLTRHTKLAMEGLEAVPGVRAYILNRVTGHFVHDYNAIEPRAVDRPDFDRFVEVYFDDMDAVRSVTDHDHMKKVFADHANFMEVDTPASLRVYEVDEQIALQRDFRVV